MASTALEPFLERDEVFLNEHADLEWVDDVHAYRCSRCTKVLVQHYIANCEHKFCANCRRLVDDGSRRWRCPLCNTFIMDIGAQSAVFRERALRLRLRCPNRKYGCPHIGPFKDIKEHLAGCEHTKERALPVLYKDGPTVEMLDRMFSAQLKNLRTEMEQRMDETEKRNARRDEWAWQLSLRANKMKQKMLRVERRQKEGEEKVEEQVLELIEKTARLKKEISDLKKKKARDDSEGLSLLIDKNKARIMKLKGKSESFYEMIDFNYRKNNELINQLKNEVEKELKILENQIQSEIDKLEQTMNEMRLEEKKEWAETKEEVKGVIDTIEEERKKREEMTSTVNKHYSQMLLLNQQVESLRKDLQNQIIKSEKKIEESEARLKRKLEDETSEIALIIEKNKSNLAQLESETDDLFKVIDAYNKKNNELTRQEVYELIESIEEERKNREKVTSAINTNSSQILELNQQIESLGKNLQNEIAKVEETIEDTEVRLKQKLEDETSEITLSMENNQTNILKLGRETDDRFNEMDNNNKKNNELTRQNLQKEFQAKVSEIKNHMEKEVIGVIETIGEERKKRQEEILATSYQITTLKQKNESFGKDLQNQIIKAEKKIEESEVKLKRKLKEETSEITLIMENNQSNIAQLESETDSRMKEIDANNSKNNELTRQQLHDEFQTTVSKINNKVRQEVNRVIETIEEERKKTQEVILTVDNQMLVLNQQINSLKKDLQVDLQNQMVKVEETIEDTEVRLKQKLEDETSEITLSMENNQTNILKVESETDVRFKEVEANNMKNNELTRQNLQKEFQTKVSEIKNKMKNEVIGVIESIEKERKMREQVTSIVNTNSSQLFALNQQIETLGKDFQNKVDEKIKESEVGMERKLKEETAQMTLTLTSQCEQNQNNMVKLESETDDRLKVMDANNKENNELTRQNLQKEFQTKVREIESELRKKWAETKGKVSEVIETIEEERKKREEVTSAVDNQILKLNQQNESLGKDLQNQIVKVEEKIKESELGLERKLKEETAQMTLTLTSQCEQNQNNIVKLKNETDDRLKVMDANNTKNNEQTRQQLKSELQAKVIEIKYEVEKYKKIAIDGKTNWAETKEEVNGFIYTIEEERKKRDEATSNVLSQILELNQQIEDLGKDLQNQIENVGEKIEETEVGLERKWKEEAAQLIMEINQTKIVKLESKTDDRFIETDANHAKNNELTRQQLHTTDFKKKVEEIESEIRMKWVETEDKVSEVIESLEEESKKREEVTSAVDNQILELNQQIKSVENDLKLDFQNEIPIELEEKVEESEAEIERKSKEDTDNRFKVIEANNKESNELPRQQLNNEVSEIKSDMEKLKEKMELKQQDKLTEVEVNIKKKVNETEEELSRLKQKLSPEQLIYNSIIKPELQHVRRVSEYYKEKGDFTWIINNVNSFLNGSEKELESKVFPLTGYPFGARAKIKLDGPYVRFSLSFKHQNQSITEEEIVVKPLPNIYFTVKDQRGGKDSKDFVQTIPFSFKKKFEFNSYYNIGVVDLSLLKSPVYTVDDQWAIAIHVETPEVAQSVYSEDGTLTWAIDDFRKKKQAEVDGLIEYQLSPYFYSSPKGHRRQAEVYLNGVDEYKNKGLSIFVDLLDGVHDEDFDFSFDYKTTVTIFHPTQPTQSISKSEEGSSWFNMGSSAEIESFLHNDTLHYKVEFSKRK